MNLGSYTRGDSFDESARLAPHERAMSRNRSRHTYKDAREDAAISPSSTELRSEDQRDQYVKWCVTELGSRPAIAVTFTFRQSLGRIRLNFETAKSTVAVFKKMLVRRLFPRNQTRRNSWKDLLYFVPVIEGGQGGAEKHIHFHGCIGVPDGVSPDALVLVCKEIWSKLRWASRTQNVVKVSDDPLRWISYIFKKRDKPSYSQAIIVELLSFASNNSRYSERRARTWRIT